MKFMKQYLIVNPYPEDASHGVHNYHLNLMAELDAKGVRYQMFSNNRRLAPERFRWEVKEFVERNYGKDEVLIEAPEAKAATILLDNGYDVHVRMHTPSAVAQRYDGAPVDQRLYAEEMLAIHKARYVSSPSYGLLSELADELRREDILVYKNPPVKVDINLDFPRAFDYDVIFMARFQPLKGIEFLEPILEKLPADFSVLLLGNNATKFRVSKRVSCHVHQIEHIASQDRFDLVARSKVLIQLSKFENCSMVILEALACGTPVVAWDVGGNGEIAPPPVLRLAPYGNCRRLAATVTELAELVTSRGGLERDLFETALTDVREDFEKGIDSVLKLDSGGCYRGMSCAGRHSGDVQRGRCSDIDDGNVSHERLYRAFGERVFGFSLSNEHIEEMWAPIVNKFGSEYLYVSRRPKGFMYKFNDPYPVDDARYRQYDWIRYPNLLIEDIKRFKPHKILFHNGLHPVYQDVLSRVKKAFPDIPFVYSELGWFPQHGNIYFDEWGTNGRSRLAQLGFEEMCGRAKPAIEDYVRLSGDYVLVVTQLENDTNLIVNSPRFKNMESFVSYVIAELGDHHRIVVKTHPLDHDKARFDKFSSETVEVVHEGDVDELLEGASAVVGINSTVLMEALKYDLNIYMFGEGLLSNKGVVIELAHESRALSRVWREHLYASREAKDMLVQAFVSRQICISELRERTLAECIEDPAFQPLVRRVASYSSKEEFDMTVRLKFPHLSKQTFDMASEIRGGELAGQYKKILALLEKQNPGGGKRSVVGKKFRKLVRDPKRFFSDSKFRVVRPIGRIL